MLAPAANAQFATGGSGAYRNNILWFRWGNNTTSIPQGGTTITNSTRVDDQFLRMTCSLSNIAGGTGASLMAYRPGDYSGDGLDDLYNIGGTGTANTLGVGLANRVDGASVTARFACSATFGPTNTGADPVFPIDGLVFADAEQSWSQQGEFVRATLTGAGSFRILETFRSSGCQTNGTVTIAGSSMTMNGSNPLCASGPVAIGFLDGATSADIAMKGGGRSAIALGVMVFVADGGDAPASYGDAPHLPDFRFTGGVPSGANWNYSTNALAQLAPPLIRLGARVDTETVSLSNANASGDDANNSDDEDALASVASVRLRAAGSHSIVVPCSGGAAATIYGYIDFNRDGDFLDPNERSAATACSGTSATVVWTMPDAAGLVDGPSYLRLRIGNTASQLSSPTGIATGGEVEDYPVTLIGATITLHKALAATGRRNANDQFVLSIAPASGVAAIRTTTGAGAAIDSAPASLDPAGVGTAHTLSESAATTTPATDLARYQTTYACTNARPGGQAPSGSGRSFTVTPVLNDDLTCIFTNTWAPTVDLAIAKTNAPAFDIRAPGDGANDAARPGATVYTLSIWNNGPDDVVDALVRDVPQAGLTCSGNVACTSVGDAVCPTGAATVAELMAGGLTIPRIAFSTSSPPQHYLTLQVPCQVL